MEKKPDKPKLVPKSIMKSRIPSEKENVIPHKKSIPKIQFSCDNTFNITSSTPNVRRETYIVKEGFLPHIKEDIHDISNDSLEITSPRKNNHFSSPLKNLNNFYSKSDNCILDTCKLYPHSQSEVDLHYISSETYTKANISTSTYVKGNLSTISPETPAKDDLNSNTYVKHEPQDLPSKNITWSARKSSSFMSNVSHIDYDINLSPIWNNSNVHQKNMSGVKVKEVIEANMWGETKEKINDCSPSKDLFRYRKRKSNDMFDTSPAKRAFLEEDASTHSSRKLDWNKTKTMSKKFYSGASYLNPFLLESTYHDEEWMEKQENIFKNWLNALLTPPVELDTKENDRPINVAKLWQQCKQNSVPLAPSKENVSNNYHVNHRLEALRKSARSLFRSNEVAEVLAKITSNIENQKLSIRTDKNVHLDLGLQSEIMTLLLSYNPLWLRIGLETIYNTGLLLTSNSDIMGISNFLMQNLFKDSFLLRKHKTIHSPKYASDIKKFILKKFLTIVYFLDFAKCKVLISHDPCLFRRNALVKESRELILSFSRELLSSVGDVTRLLRFMGYTVNHKQTYIQEFNYAVVHLGVDLRDGVRLTKVMEVILLRKDLTERLRVPAVSRLQKIHNMSLVFDALAEANFAIIGDISPRDIVDGHHEKCLSFLWQIIYKFQAPLMANSAMKIQKWWRSLPIVLKRRRKARRILSAVKIQKWYRRHLLAIKLIKIIPVIQDMLTQRMLTHSAITIQSTFRMYVQKKKYGQIKHSVIMIQSLVRGNLLRKCVRQKLHSIVTIQAYARMYIDRKKYLRIRASVIYLQQMYRAKQLMLKEMAKFQKLKASVLLVQQRYRSNKSTQIERQRYLTVKSAVITLQVHFRAFISMKSERTKYLQIKCACITIQRYFRSYQKMKKNAKNYSDLRQAVVIVQRRYRANQLAKTDRLNYNRLKSAAILIQRRFRAKKQMQLDYSNYQSLKKAALVLQRRYRAKRLGKTECERYNVLKKSVVTIQRRFRANKSMRAQRHWYQQLRAATIIIQRQFRAKKERETFNALQNSVIIVQRRFRANKAMKAQRQIYLELRSVTINVQRRFRAQLLMHIEVSKFSDRKKAAIAIQSKYRATVMMRNERTKYEALKKAAVTIQTRFRANQIMKLERSKYVQLQKSTIVIQRRFRAYKLMQNDSVRYKILKETTVIIQRRFRANKAMQVQRTNYENLKKAALLIQRRYTAKRLGKTECERYNVLKKSVVTIQRRFRANKSMRAQRHWYQQLRATTIIIQRQFRAQLAKKERETFNALQKSVIIVQRRFRANKAMKAQRQIYLELRSVTINVQRRFRAQLLMHIEVSKFSDRKKAAIAIQSKYRATVMMRIERTKYEALKKAAVTIQTRFRANQIMKLERSKYVQLQKSTIVIQRRFRAYKLMQSDSVRYKTLKETTAIIQRRFRANKAMQVQRTNYENLKKAALLIQRRYRAKRLGKKEFERYNVLKKTVVTIQRRFRENNAMKTQRRLFLQLRTATIVIQRRFRAKRLMRNEMSKLSELKQSVVIIQRKFRATLMMRLERAKYETLKKSVVTIQIRFRANRLMKLERSKYTRLQKAVIVVQQRFRANKLMQADLVRYKQLKEVTISIQRRFRANKLMKMEYTNYQRLRRTIVFIQQAFRTRMANNMVKIDTAVITIQRRFRAFQQMKIEHIKYYQMKRAAIIIQRRWRRFVNENEGYKLKRLQNAAATKLQACWKGYKVRKAHPNIRRIRNNVKDLTANSFPQNTLQNRRESAIKILRDAPTLHQILLALEDLDYITRRCQNTLRSMSESLPAQLYLFVKSANRSPAEMELSTIAVSILINFYKYEPTSASAWVPSRIDHLIIVMSHCCDKEEKLFPYLCTLIWLFAHNSDYKKFICSLPTFSNLFKTIKNLCLRKQKMVARKNPIIASYFRSVSHPPQPLLTPDWGLDYKNRPRTFMNSIHALNSVLKILDYD